jgi:hypothetical protein
MTSRFLFVAFVVHTVACLAQEPVAELTSEEDHQRMMNLLGISGVRPGANGRDPNAPNAANYDESKVLPIERLPDPLTLKNGKKIRKEKQWADRRREIIEDFDREVLGRVPSDVPTVNWEIISTSDEQVGDRQMKVKTLLGHVNNSSYPLIKVDINLRVATPAGAGGPVPVILQLAWFFPPGTNPPVDPTPGQTWKEQLAAKGWGYAEIVPTSVQADNGAGLTRGIIGLTNKGQPRKPDDWGALRAWAWGASKAFDYFETDKDVDVLRVGIEGHSRYGKAAVVAMAYDPRFAVGFISSSGEGGLSLYRRNFGEILENVAGTGEYHWMAGNLIKYAGPLTANDLPIDAHELIALCAPRPVFISSGDDGDQWTDPKGMFLAGVYASPVYELLGKKGLGTTEYPAPETGLMDGEISFRQHSGGHTPGPNWSHFLDYAERYFYKK